METYKFNWDVFITDDLIDGIKSIAGLDPGDSIEAMTPAISRILISTGGLPLTQKQFTPQERTKIAKELLHEGVKHIFKEIYTERSSAKGYTTEPSSVPELENLVKSIERIPVNTADTETLESLPHIGNTLAERIIKERISKGPYTSIDDLDERVEGLGEQKIEDIRYLITIDDGINSALEVPSLTGNFEDDFSAVIKAQKGSSNTEKLESALNMIAMHCSDNPHPYTRNLLTRDFDIPEATAATNSEWAGILFGYEYFKCVPELIKNAGSKIEVCMFHIAFPDASHPTFNFLQALKEAKDNGVNVRVLIDRDRESDPYLSTIINSEAKNYFEQNGIECKFDKDDRLLHSKYVIIDDELVVIGSHNWSSGSYFNFDDLSFAVKSPALVTKMRAKFDQLWSSN